MERLSQEYSLSQKQLTRIGKFVVEWSRADMATNHLVVTWLGIDWHDAIPFVYRQHLGPKLEALSKLIQRRVIPKKYAKKLNEAIPYLLSKVGERNYIIHGYWLFREGDAVSAVSYSKWDMVSMSITPFKLTTKSLDDLIKGTRDAAHKLDIVDQWLRELSQPPKD